MSDAPRKPPFVTAQAHRNEWLKQFRPFLRDTTRKPAPPTAVLTPAEEPAPDVNDFDPKHVLRYVSPGEEMPTLKERMREAIEQQFLQDKYTLDDFTPYRIRVAYRVVLAMAQGTGTLRRGETLADAMNIRTFAGNPATTEAVDPWMFPRKLPTMALPTNPSADGATPRQIIALYLKDNKDAELPLLPPPVPRRWVNAETDEVHPHYNPEMYSHDKQLYLYVNVFKAIYQALGIGAGSYQYPYYGKYGFVGLDSPLTIRFAFPTRGELLAFESILVQDTINLIMEFGPFKTYDKLKAEYGLTHRECEWIVNIARAQAKTYVSNDVEEDKALMILRLEDVIRRARAELNLKAETSAIKVLADIQQLKQTEREDFKTQAATIIREFNEQDNAAAKQRAPIPAHIALPAPGQVPTDPRDG